MIDGIPNRPILTKRTSLISHLPRFGIWYTMVYHGIHSMGTHLFLGAYNDLRWFFRVFNGVSAINSPFRVCFRSTSGSWVLCSLAWASLLEGPFSRPGMTRMTVAEGCNSGISWGQWMSIFMELLDPKSNGSNGGCILPMDPMDAQMLISIESWSQIDGLQKFGCCWDKNSGQDPWLMISLGIPQTNTVYYSI